MKTNNWNQSELKCISVSDLSGLIDTNPELHEFVPYRGRLGREKRESRESWIFCLGFILRRTDIKLGRLFLRPFAFGDEFRRQCTLQKKWKLFGP